MCSVGDRHLRDYRKKNLVMSVVTCQPVAELAKLDSGLTLRWFVYLRYDVVVWLGKLVLIFIRWIN